MSNSSCEKTETMTEVQFAKSFLAALDGRPIKLQADYVEDPKNYPSRPPVRFLSWDNARSFY